MTVAVPYSLLHRFLLPPPSEAVELLPGGGAMQACRDWRRGLLYTHAFAQGNRVTLLHIIYLIAIAAEAASGALMGMRRGMDLFGLALVGTVTALGGGSIRDMVLGHYPLGWVAIRNTCCSR